MAASQHNSKKHILHNQANDPWATTSRNKPGSNNKAKHTASCQHTANNRGLYSLFGVQLWGSPWCEESPVSSSSSPPFSMLKVDIPSPTVSGRRQDKAVVLPLTGNNHWNLPKSFSFQSKHILMCLFVSCVFIIIIIIYFGWPFKVAQHSLFEGGFGRHDWHRCCLVIIMFFLVAVPNWSTQLEEALLYSPQWDI